jgi:hypothetical protein
MGTAGTVTAIDGTTLTVETTASGTAAATTVQVTTTDATVVTETVDGTTSDLAVGDHVRAMGTTDADGAVSATDVTDSGDQELAGPGGGLGGGTPPAGAPTGEGAPTAPDGSQGGPGGRGTSGTITAIDGDVLTVESTDGAEVQVTLTADTTVSLNRVIALGDLATGDTVLVMGTTTDATVAATTIRRGDLPTGGFAGGPGGTPPAGASPPDGSSGATVTSTTTT